MKGFQTFLTFLLPTKIILGLGCRRLLGQEAKSFGKRALVLCSKSVSEQSELLQPLLQSLTEVGVAYELYSGCHGEPTTEQIERGRILAHSLGADVVIGVGGGSVIDTAKAVAGLSLLPGTVKEYLLGKEVEGTGLPWIAVPTTAGSGAEVTPNAVLSDPDQQIKTSIRSSQWFAKVALVDPELTLGVPSTVTAACGSDALCQAIEAYVSISSSPVTDALAGEAIRRIARSLVKAYCDGQDIVARSDMLYGSLLAGIALANARLGAVHGLAHPIGIRYGIPHGVICGILLPHVMAFNLPWALEKYAQIAEWLEQDITSSTEEMALKSVTKVRELLAKIGLPERLREVGVKREDFAFIIERSLPSGSLKHNPRPLDANDLERILTDAW